MILLSYSCGTLTYPWSAGSASELFRLLEPLFVCYLFTTFPKCYLQYTNRSKLVARRYASFAFLCGSSLVVAVLRIASNRCVRINGRQDPANRWSTRAHRLVVEGAGIIMDARPRPIFRTACQARLQMTCTKQANSASESVRRLGKARQLIKNQRSDTTSRRSRDMRGIILRALSAVANTEEPQRNPSADGYLCYTLERHLSMLFPGENRRGG
jgi:hypothetical protein